MTTLNDFSVVDETTDNLASLHNRLLGMGFRAEFSNTQTITATKELTDGDTQYQVITASGANRTVELPPEASTNHLHVIINAGASNNVLVKDDSGAVTFITLLPGDWCLCIPFLGLTWKVMLQTPEQNFTPAFPNLTIGNGTMTAKYLRIGNLINFHIEFTFGSTSSLSGDLTFNLPVPAASTYGLTVNPIGVARFRDASGSAYQGATQLATITTGNAVVYDTSGAYAIAATPSGTVPFTWTNPDTIGLQGAYFAA